MSEEKKYNPGFAFYDTYYKAMEHFPLEIQKEICYALVKYGITNEVVDPDEMPNGYALVRSNEIHIKESVNRWRLNQNKANFKIDNLESRNYLIAQLINEGKNSKEIAAIISNEYEKISDSAVRKTEPWKERKNEDFKEKWLNKNVNDSQNLEQNSCENVNVNDCEERENSQNFTEVERENSQENVKAVTAFNF